MLISRTLYLDSEGLSAEGGVLGGIQKLENG